MISEEHQSMANRLFNLALSGALLLGATGAALAQDNAPPPPDQQQGPGMAGRGPMRMDPDQQLQRMTKQLDLSADQQSQMKPLLVERQQKMEALFQDQSLAPEDRRAKMQSIRQESQSKIEAVLNDQQKQKFEAMQERRGRRGGENGPPPPPDGAQPPQ
jgi:Spy/CpxP family protein refolding chaperone